MYVTEDDARKAKVKVLRTNGKFVDTRMHLHVIVTAKKMNSMGEGTGENESLPWQADVDLVRYLCHIAFNDKSDLLTQVAASPAINVCDMGYMETQCDCIDHERIKIVVADFQPVWGRVQTWPSPGAPPSPKFPDSFWKGTYGIQIADWATKMNASGAKETPPRMIHITARHAPSHAHCAWRLLGLPRGQASAAL